MKKLFLIGVFLITCSIKIVMAETKDSSNNILVRNIEALNEDPEPNPCPLPDYVPDRYITVTVFTIPVLCTKDGVLSIGTHILSGGYKEGEVYEIPLAMYKCDGEQKGACCDQARVGVVDIFEGFQE